MADEISLAFDEPLRKAQVSDDNAVLEHNHN
jgi:hypothetical protein